MLRDYFEKYYELANEEYGDGLDAAIDVDIDDY